MPLLLKRMDDTMNAKRKRRRQLRILIVVGITLLLAALLILLLAWMWRFVSDRLGGESDPGSSGVSVASTATTAAKTGWRIAEGKAYYYGADGRAPIPDLIPSKARPISLRRMGRCWRDGSPKTPRAITAPRAVLVKGWQGNSGDSPVFL